MEVIDRSIVMSITVCRYVSLSASNPNPNDSLSSVLVGLDTTTRLFVCVLERLRNTGKKNKKWVVNQ